MTRGHKKQKKEGLGAMSQGMRLTFLRFRRLMDANLRREPPRADGFPTHAA